MENVKPNARTTDSLATLASEALADAQLSAARAVGRLQRTNKASAQRARRHFENAAAILRGDA